MTNMADHQDITLTATEGYEIPATLTRPAGEVIGSALLLHGIFTERHEDGRFVRLAERLASAGILSLRIDLAGHGESKIKPESTTPSKMANEAAQAFRFLEVKYGTPPHIIASSFSGTLLCMLLASNAILPHGKLVFLNPVLDFRSVFLEPETQEFEDMFTSQNVSEAMRFGSFHALDRFKMSREFLIQMNVVNVPNLVRFIHDKFLVIFGNQDDLVSYDTAKKIVDNNQLGHWSTIDGAGHAFDTQHHEKEAHEQVLDWLKDLNA